MNANLGAMQGRLDQATVDLRQAQDELKAKDSALGDLARENEAVKAEAPPAALVTGLER